MGDRMASTFDRAAFDPEGQHFDMETAQQFGMVPNEAGHYGSVVPTTKDQIRREKLPRNSYMMLKGRGHPTFDKAVEGERLRGFKIIKRSSRYFSVPVDFKE